MELSDVLKLNVGTVLQKGNRKRIVMGFDGFFVYYKTSHNSKKVTGLFAPKFLKWAEKAEVINE